MRYTYSRLACSRYSRLNFQELFINRDDDTAFIGAPLLDVLDRESTNDLIVQKTFFPIFPYEEAEKSSFYSSSEEAVLIFRDIVKFQLLIDQ